MLIDIRYERGSGWSLVDEPMVQLIPELRDVLLEKTLGVNAICVIALSCDPLSKIRMAYGDKPDRINAEAYRWVNKTKGDANDFYKLKLVVNAIAVYQDLCDTPVSKMVRMIQETAYNTIEMIHEQSKSKENAPAIADIIKLPDLLDKYITSTESQSKDIRDVKSRVRGDRPLSPAEQNIKKRQKLK